VLQGGIGSCLRVILSIASSDENGFVPSSPLALASIPLSKMGNDDGRYDARHTNF
jgi:hypothetical protein